VAASSGTRPLGRWAGFTMASFIFSDMRVLGQIGTTIALGLMFDTLIVRSFMAPSIAARLGRWFWWPVRVRQRPIPRTSATRTHARWRCSSRTAGFERIRWAG
jgi:uncharacterized membrane protein YdfJ with MMPL/SSD domain